MARARGNAEHSPATPGRGRARRRPWLRTARLNAAGWTALLGACLAAVAVGVAVCAALALPRWPGAALAAVPLVALVVADRKRWAAIEFSYGWGGSPEDVARIVAELRAQGVDARVELHDDAQGWGDPADHDHPVSEPMPQSAALTYRNGDAAQVAATLRAHGVPPAQLA